MADTEKHQIPPSLEMALTYLGHDRVAEHLEVSRDLVYRWEQGIELVPTAKLVVLMELLVSYMAPRQKPPAG